MTVAESKNLIRVLAALVPAFLFRSHHIHLLSGFLIRHRGFLTGPRWGLKVRVFSLEAYLCRVISPSKKWKIRPAPCRLMATCIMKKQAMIKMYCLIIIGKKTFPGVKAHHILPYQYILMIPGL